MVGTVQPEQHKTFLLSLTLILVGVLHGCTGSSTGERETETPSSNDGRVTILEFGDYQCGPCARMGRQLHRLSTQRRGQFRLIYRHCPSRRHPVGRRAAIVAAAAQELGSFWDLHWELVMDGPIEDEEQLWEITRGIGLDEAQVLAVIRTGRPERVVTQDLALADRNGVRGMPTTFVNGRRFEGTISLERLMGVVDEATGLR